MSHILEVYARFYYTRPLYTGLSESSMFICNNLKAHKIDEAVTPCQDDLRRANITMAVASLSSWFVLL